MILLQRNDAIGIVVVTALEMAVGTPASYTIRLVHELTKAEVLFEGLIDTSLAPERYNRFELDMSAFSDVDNGFFNYTVSDQEGNELETGKAKLEGDKPVMVQYDNTPTEYKTYGK